MRLRRVVLEVHAPCRASPHRCSCSAPRAPVGHRGRRPDGRDAGRGPRAHRRADLDRLRGPRRRTAPGGAGRAGTCARRRPEAPAERRRATRGRRARPARRAVPALLACGRPGQRRIADRVEQRRGFELRRRPRLAQPGLAPGLGRAHLRLARGPAAAGGNRCRRWRDSPAGRALDDPADRGRAPHPPDRVGVVRHGPLAAALAPGRLRPDRRRGRRDPVRRPRAPAGARRRAGADRRRRVAPGLDRDSALRATLQPRRSSSPPPTPRRRRSWCSRR